MKPEQSPLHFWLRTASFGSALLCCCLCPRIAAGGDGALPGLSDFQQGKYSVPASAEAKADESALDGLRRYLRFLQAEGAARKERLDDLDVHDLCGFDPAALDLARSYVECADLMAICSSLEGTAAGQAAVLLLAATATTWPAGISIAPVSKALEKIQDSTADPWQGRLAVLLRAHLMENSSESGSESERAKRAVAFLRNHVPPKDFSFDSGSAEFRAITEVFPVVLPLRAAFLVSIARMEYDLVTAGTTISAKDAEEVEAICREIMRDYPDSEPAKWAADIADRRIPRLRKLLKE